MAAWRFAMTACALHVDGIRVLSAASMRGCAIALLSVVAFTDAGAAGQAQEQAYFSASPTSGQAPLTVKFCASAGIGIDFGDGTSSGMGLAQSGDCTAVDASFTTHLYSKPGAYRLRGFPCPGIHASHCEAVARQASALTITVTAP